MSMKRTQKSCCTEVLSSGTCLKAWTLSVLLVFGLSLSSCGDDDHVTIPDPKKIVDELEKKLKESLEKTKWFTTNEVLLESPFQGERKVLLKANSKPATSSRDLSNDFLGKYGASSFATKVNYSGAVAPTGTAWYAESVWSMFAHLVDDDGSKYDKVRPQGQTRVDVTDESLRTAMGTDKATTWVKTTTYVVSGRVFVQDGETLTIEPGTVIKGKPGTGDNASALIVSRGGKLMAVGTAAEPIIFTFEADPLDGSTAPTTRGRWGGLILLGKSKLNSTPGETAIEGIPTSEKRGLYGGTELNDSSGELKYVSIRHGGSDIGAGNEINGLTLGGVGRGTMLSYVEVIGNKDDGIEWFGGTVNGKYLISAYCNDDALDSDEGYLGLNQFVIVYQDTAEASANRGGEHDGGTTPETAKPYSVAAFVNLTSIGNPKQRALTVRDNAGIHVYNSVFQGYGKGIDIEDLKDGEDSAKRMTEGDVSFNGCFFHNIGSSKNPVDLFAFETPE